MSCNQRCIHPQTSASSHRSQGSPKPPGSGQVSGHNFSLRKLDCPVVVLCKDGRVPGNASQIAGGREEGPGVNRVPLSIQQLLLRATVCQALQAQRMPTLTGLRTRLLEMPAGLWKVWPLLFLRPARLRPLQPLPVSVSSRVPHTFLQLFCLPSPLPLSGLPPSAVLSCAPPGALAAIAMGFAGTRMPLKSSSLAPLQGLVLPPQPWSLAPGEALLGE